MAAVVFLLIVVAILAITGFIWLCWSFPVSMAIACFIFACIWLFSNRKKPDPEEDDSIW